MLQNLAQFFSDNTVATILSAIASYLIGSVSFAIIITRLFIKEDIRTMGSGNAGMTNVFRSVGKLAGVLTLIGDLSKSIISVFICRAIYRAYGGSEMFIDIGMSSPILIASYISGLFCLLGHLYPIYFNFRGGKGVLVTAGMLLVVDYRILLIVLSVFLIVFFISRIVSLSTIIAVLLLPVMTFLLGYYHPFSQNGMDSVYLAICTVLSGLFTIIVIFMHRANIGRLIRGEEKKLVLKKNK